MTIQECFSQNLIKLRKKRGLSQKDLATLSELSPRMIAHYETQVSHPSLDKLQQLAQALNVSISELISNSPPKQSESDDFLSTINVRTLKQLKKIMQLSPQDRSNIYRMVDSLLEKRNISGEQKKSTG
jgi:transcriptional regulator with XRE-family HTH domain